MKIKSLWQSDKTFFYIYVLCVIAISVYLGLYRIYLSDYSTVNGDFQNYNIIRRILDGQIPYTEFTNYLGMGIVLINTPFIALHNVFTTSLFVTNVTTALCFLLAVTFLLFLITGNKYYSYFSGTMFTLAAIFVSRYSEPLSWYFGINLYEPGNSMRMQRAFLAFLLGFMFYYIIKKKKIDIFGITRSNNALAAIGIIIGFSTAWSSDFGLACVLSSFIIFFTLLIKGSGKIQLKTIGQIVLYLLAMAVGFLIQAVIVTRGDLPAYLDFVRGVSAYQYWYYGVNINKYLSIIDVLGNKTYIAFVVLFLMVTVHYMWKLLRGTISACDISIYFIGLSTFIASLIYIYGSGWMAYDPFRLTTILICIGLIWTRLSDSLSDKIKNNLNLICKVGLYVSLTISTVLVITAAVRLTTDRGFPYVEELGGYTKFAEGLSRTKDYIGGDQVFSTYALALEAMTGQFQPTGTDYIIHVLGDLQRQNYINNFRHGDYQYVTTSYNVYMPFEAWVKRANWFFYRELYKNYKPSFNTDYLVMWEPLQSVKISAEISCEVSRINDHTYEISLSSDNKEHIVADVILSYKSEFAVNTYRLQTFRKLVVITDESMAEENAEKWNTYFIPPASNGYYLPICLKNGVGKITISSLPSACTVLEIIDLQIIDLLPDYHYSLTNQ
jgi:hypothetical protein